MNDKSAFNSRTILTEQRRNEERKVRSTFVFHQGKQKMEWVLGSWCIWTWPWGFQMGLHYTLVWGAASEVTARGPQWSATATAGWNLSWENRTVRNTTFSRRRTKSHVEWCYRVVFLIQMNIHVLKTKNLQETDSLKKSSWHFSVLAVWNI